MFEYDRLALDITQQFFTSMPPNAQRYYYHQHKQQQQPYYDSVKNSEMNINRYINNDKLVEDLFSNNAQKIKTTTSQTSSKFTPPTNSTDLANNVGINGYYIQQKQLSKSIDNSDETNRRLSGISNSYGDCIFDCGASSGYGSPGVAGTPLASPAPNSAHYIAHQLQKMLDQEFCETMINSNSNQFSLTLNGSTINHPVLKANKGILTPRIQVASDLSSNLPIQNTYDMLENIYNLDDDLAWKKLCFDDDDDDFFDQTATAGKLLVEVTTKNSDNNMFEIDNNKDIFERNIASPTMTTSSTPETTTSSATAIAAAAVEDGFSANEIAQFAQLLCSPKKAPPQRYQCHICYQTGHYISDCPMRFNSPYEELTPYQGRKKCYGEFQCQLCKRKWTSQNSVANEAQSCIKCHVPVFPHKQLPVDKAIALGLVKSQRILPTKITPIGHGRPLALDNNAISADNAMTSDFSCF